MPPPPAAAIAGGAAPATVTPIPASWLTITSRISGGGFCSSSFLQSFSAVALSPACAAMRPSYQSAFWLLGSAASASAMMSSHAPVRSGHRPVPGPRRGPVAAQDPSSTTAKQRARRRRPPWQRLPVIRYERPSMRQPSRSLGLAAQPLFELGHDLLHRCGVARCTVTGRHRRRRQRIVPREVAESGRRPGPHRCRSRRPVRMPAAPPWAPQARPAPQPAADGATDRPRGTWPRAPARRRTR